MNTWTSHLAITSKCVSSNGVCLSYPMKVEIMPQTIILRRPVILLIGFASHHHLIITNSFSKVLSWLGIITPNGQLCSNHSWDDNVTSIVHCLQGQSSAASVIMTGFAFEKNSLIRENNQPLFKGPKRLLRKISFSNLWNCSGLRPETRGISTLLTPFTAILWGPT